MYLTKNEGSRHRLAGLGFEWSEILTAITPVAKQVADVVVAKQVAKATPAPTVPKTISPGPGGATMPGPGAPKLSIWSNPWTWVAVVGGVALLGTGVALMARRS
jgi:hypothetical protein